jgi:hypothetical protein
MKMFESKSRPMVLKAVMVGFMPKADRFFKPPEKAAPLQGIGMARPRCRC